MKIYFFALMLIFANRICAKELTASTTFSIDKNELIEQKIIDNLYKLHEVRVVDKQLTRLHFNLSIIVVKRPTHNEPYYIIDVGHSDKLRFETRYEFKIARDCINKANIEPYLAVWDGLKGDYVSLYNYRKINHT